MEQLGNAIDISSEQEYNFSGSVGQTISFKVQGNITTGYNWFINKDNYDSSAVLCTNLSEYGTGEYLKASPDTNESDPTKIVCGRPGFLLFSFELKKKGEYNIVLEYKRAWQTDISQAKKIHFIVE